MTTYVQHIGYGGGGGEGDNTNVQSDLQNDNTPSFSLFTQLFKILFLEFWNILEGDILKFLRYFVLLEDS